MAIDKYYYNKERYIKTISDIILIDIKTGKIEDGKRHLEELKNIYVEKNINKLDMDFYIRACENLENISKELIDIEGTEEEISGIYNCIIEIVDEFNNNIESYEQTRKSKTEYQEVKMKLELYKENAKKYI